RGRGEERRSSRTATSVTKCRVLSSQLSQNHEKDFTENWELPAKNGFSAPSFSTTSWSVPVFSFQSPFPRWHQYLPTCLWRAAPVCRPVQAQGTSGTPRLGLLALP